MNYPSLNVCMYMLNPCHRQPSKRSGNAFTRHLLRWDLVNRLVPELRFGPEGRNVKKW